MSTDFFISISSMNMFCVSSANAIRTITTSCLDTYFGVCTWSGSFPGASIGRHPLCCVAQESRVRQALQIGTLEAPRLPWQYILTAGALGGFILLFFSLSTNQEYYTYPAYFPLLLLTAVGLANLETDAMTSSAREQAVDMRWLEGAQALFAIVGLGAAAMLAYGLWASRHLPYVADIGALLAHRDVGGYWLSMSHFFDLTGPSFAALRLPALLAAATLLLGPSLAWRFRVRKQHLTATFTTAMTAAMFLVAAHIAFVRFQPMLSSRAMANTIHQMAAPDDMLLLYGDQSYGSSILFYTQRRGYLVNGRTTSMLWGSYYPDAPHIFLDDAQLLAMWGHGPRKFLFLPPDYREHVEELLGNHAYLVQELSDKELLTDRPLNR